jgi:hypothetical protein
MKYWCLFLLTWLVNPLALPQQAMRQEAPVLEAAQPPRRAQLRSALQAARETAAASAAASSAPQAQEPLERHERHLSEKERADLRQQLRQQRLGHQSQRP